MNQVEQTHRLIALLAKYHAGIELAGKSCPLCSQVKAHDEDCPINIAWGLLDDDTKEQARTVVRGWIEKMEDEPFDWPRFLSLSTDNGDDQEEN